MSNMLEQAIVDAATLREAALKNAEQSIIEKYSPQIKEAVNKMLEGVTPENKMKHEGRVVNVIHEADEDGNVTVSEGGGKAYVVNESELSSLTEDELLQEEEAAALGGNLPPTPEIEAPPAWDSRYGDDSRVTLTALVDPIEDGGHLEIDLDSLELSMAQKQEASQEQEEAPIEQPEETGMEEPTDDGEDALDDLFGDEGGLNLQEVVDAISSVLEEEIEVDMDEDLTGHIDTAKGSRQYESDKGKAKRAHLDEEEEEEESSEEEEDEKLQEALSEINQLQETFLILKKQNEKLESVVHKLNEKLEETLLSNAKLLYQNRTLNDASLNERQKTKIVEAIGNAESPKEAKSLQETLRATVGSEQKKGPQSLNETVNRRSNLSSMLNTRQNLNESQNSDPFFDKMRKLAGIKK